MTRAARAASGLAFSAARPAAAHCASVIAQTCRAPPFILYDRTATCWQPQVKGFVHHHNSIYNNWRFENVWLDK